MSYLHKRSTVTGVVPTAGALVVGEIAMNAFDGKVFLKKTDGSVIEVGAAGGGAAAAGTLTGATLAANVLASSLTSVGTLAALTVTAPITGSVTDANLTGEVTTSGLAATLANSAVIGKVLTGYASGAGTVAATDTILQAIQKLDGNAGAIDHGLLTGLADDDHTQYHNDARGDARYPLIAHTHALSELTQSSALAFDCPQWNGSAWVAKETQSGLNRIVMKTDFNTVGEFTMYSAGTGASTTFLNSYQFDGRYGYAASNTGTTSTGVGGVGSALQDGIILGTYATWVCDIIRLPALSTALQRYAVDSGLLDNRVGGASAPVDGAFFQYSDSVNSGKWLCCCYNNNTPTTADSGITVAANTWYKLEIKISTTQALFYIDGTLVATVGGIPTGTARAVGKSCSIRKSVGTTAATMINDYTHFIQDSAR